MAGFFEQYVAIDYGTTLIKGVLYRAATGKPKILRAESLPIVNLPESGGEASADPNEEAREYEYNVIRFVQSFFPEESNFLLNMPPAGVFVRDLELPVTDVKQIQELMPYEVENVLPVSLEEAEVIGRAWEVKDDTARVVTFTSLHKNLQARAAPFSRKNQNLRMLSLEAAGLSGGIRLLSPEYLEDRVVAQLDVGGERSLFNVLKNGELVFTRAISYGGSRFTEIIAAIGKIELEDAEKLKRDGFFRLNDPKAEIKKTENGITPARYKKIIAALGEAAVQMVEEIERSVLSLKCSEPDVYFVSGGGSLIPGFLPLVGETLERRAETYPLDFEGEEDVSLWITALGTGEHYLLNKDDRLDFLRGPFGRMLQRNQFNWRAFIAPVSMFAAGVLILGAAFLLGLAAKNRQFEQYRVSFYKVAQTISGLKTDRISVATILRRAKTICNRKMRGRMGREGITSIELLLDITRKIPAQDKFFFRFERFDYDGKTVQVRGIVDDFDSVSLLINKLRESSNFSDVKVKEQKRLVTKKVQVRLNLILKKDALGKKGGCA